MDRDPSGVEARLDTLAARLHAVEARLAALEAAAARRMPDAAEASGAGVSSVAPATGTPALAALRAAPPLAVVPVLTLVGRTLVVLGGAFLLRAVTEAAIVPRPAGTAAGLGYAVLWILLGDRAAAGGHRGSAAFHGLAGALVAYPLIAEATLKFNFLSAWTAAAALAATTAVGLGVAWRRTLASLAWVVTLGTVAAALGMIVATREFFPFTACLLLLGLATLWAGYTRGWHLLGGFGALTADAIVLLVTLAFAAAGRRSTPPVIGPGALLCLQFGLVAAYFGSLASRSLLRRHELDLLEILQAAIAFLVGLGGALGLVRWAGSFGALVGAAVLALAAGCYGVSFTFIDRQQGRRTNFLFYSTLALVLTLVGMNTLLAGSTRVVIYAGLSLLTAWLGSRRQRATLSGHGAFYAAAAAVRSGMLPGALVAFGGPDLSPARSATLPALVVLGVTLANCWFEVAQHGRTWGRLSHLPKIVVLLVLGASAGGMAVEAAAALLGVGSSGRADAAVLAAIRTGVLGLCAVVLAAIGRWPRFLAAAWLTYPVLILGGLKLLAEDLRRGRPATVFASLVLYGIALILAPRLVRRARRT